MIVGNDTANSEWIADEVRLSNEKDPPNVPDGVPDHAEELDWHKPSDVTEIGPAIERAAAARDQVPKMKATTPGTGRDWGR